MLSAPLAMRILAGPAGLTCCSLTSIAKRGRLAAPSSSFTRNRDRLHWCFQNGQSARISQPPRNSLMVNWRGYPKRHAVYSILQRSCTSETLARPLQLMLLDARGQFVLRLRSRERFVTASTPSLTRSGSDSEIRFFSKGQRRNFCRSASHELCVRGDHGARFTAGRVGDRFFTPRAEGSRGHRLMWSRGLGNSSSTEQSPSRQPARAIAEDGQHNAGLSPSTDLEKEKFTGVEIKPTKTLLTLPTILTLARVAAVPALIAVFYAKESWTTPAGAIIFVVAALTDWLDGYLARRGGLTIIGTSSEQMGSSSQFGAFLDPVADKLMVAAALVLLCTRPLGVPELAAFPWLLPVPTIAIIGREITMSAVREWAASQGGDLHKAVAVSSLGKIKTASQMIAITLLLVCGEGGLDSAPVAVLGVGLLYVAAGLALWSLRMYMKGIWGSMLK